MNDWNDSYWIQRGCSFPSNFFFLQNCGLKGDTWVLFILFYLKIYYYIISFVYSQYYILERFFLLSLIWLAGIGTYLLIWDNSYLHVFWTKGTDRFCQLCLKCRHLWKLETCLSPGQRQTLFSDHKFKDNDSLWAKVGQF